MALHREHQELIAMRAAASSKAAKRKATAVPLTLRPPQRPDPNGPSSSGAAAVAEQLMNVTYVGDIKISADDAARVSQRSKKALVESRKLMLVLDLDHTLLNSKAEAHLVDEVRAVAGAC